MSREIKGILFSRLLVLVSIVLIPIITFLIYIFADFKLWFAKDNEDLTLLIINILCPLVFSISWLFFLILFANRFAETIESTDRVVGVIPLRLKLFYGLNALYILLIFVFPLITPVISILTFASFGWRLTTMRKERWEEDTKVSLLTKIIMILASILPIFCAVVILPEYIKLSIFLWSDIWVPLLDIIYIISYCLCTALAIGSLFILFANAGISEYEQIFEDTTRKRFVYIKIFEIVLFGFFLVLALYDFYEVYDFEVVNLFYNAGFVIVLIVSIVNYISGKQKTSKFQGHLAGYILAAIFMGSNLIFISETEFSDFMRTTSLLISGILFILVFLYTFIHLEEPELT
ncbi:MAG: hypothetical protein ACFFA6_01985 [Promethearchaeota archaeon]